MENRAHALAAGAFALLLLLAALGAVWWFGGKREVTRDYLVVTPHNVTGLNLQGQVRYRGIRVGRVEAINLDPADGRNILIRVSVAESVPVTKGTTAKLGYQGMTGIAHVLLEDAGKDLTVPDRSAGLPRIPMQSSLLQDLSDTGSATLRQAQILLTSMNELLGPENKARIGKTLANLETGSANLSATLAEVKVLLADPRIKQLGSAIANIDGATGEAKGLLREIAVLVPRMTALTVKLDQMVGEVNGEGLAASGARLQELGRELTLTSRQLNHTLQMLEDAPQSLLFGPPPVPPGPGESGFVPPAAARP
ncbi:MAG: phospholipid/cholesterol/gamma-HCH transport system substrate-binding protein [Pseudomonadota bacterium]|jgi:phospholipid/cholesterol/gamma-HCH transport system substrate-binding protein|nr:phospholipid/cholesterol/gamma-HCH transport system substrate-binding protein [Pseudomonadota bacterium]MDQ5918409.1 phospholipid/cholesterol/gamma-HCH transport system substrate-binding protein [Pseudomonadota bacterium]MDQ5941498.1 phospholipid/cholesterol/gamma-HCH transport system substrate-binding protein [Pseudomonadota bacterium]MDQ5960939.1 phospholipid/cholesterol/gamma-HCH transport system substrate-binding protein [Pseudomonadota bacterium]